MWKLSSPKSPEFFNKNKKAKVVLLKMIMIVVHAHPGINEYKMVNNLNWLLGLYKNKLPYKTPFFSHGLLFLIFHGKLYKLQRYKTTKLRKSTKNFHACKNKKEYSFIEMFPVTRSFFNSWNISYHGICHYSRILACEGGPGWPHI